MIVIIIELSCDYYTAEAVGAMRVGREMLFSVLEKETVLPLSDLNE